MQGDSIELHSELEEQVMVVEEEKEDHGLEYPNIPPQLGSLEENQEEVAATEEKEFFFLFWQQQVLEGVVEAGEDMEEVMENAELFAILWMEKVEEEGEEEEKREKKLFAVFWE